MFVPLCVLCVWCFEFRFAGDLERQGVALSRHCQIVAMGCTRIAQGDHPLLAFLDAQKFAPVVAEAKQILPTLRGLIASEAQKNKKSRSSRGEQSMASMMADSPASGYPREAVAGHARALHAWLVKADSPLRQFLSAASDGGAFFTSNVHVKTAVGYVKYRVLDPDSGTPGVGSEDFVRAAQCRLCD